MPLQKTFSSRIPGMELPSSNLFSAWTRRTDFWRSEMDSKKKAIMREHSTGYLTFQHKQKNEDLVCLGLNADHVRPCRLSRPDHVLVSLSFILVDP
jgi:hypothetical protein